MFSSYSFLSPPVGGKYPFSSPPPSLQQLIWLQLYSNPSNLPSFLPSVGGTRDGADDNQVDSVEKLLRIVIVEGKGREVGEGK